MELGTRNTKKYTFKSRDLTELKKLSFMIVSPEDFRAQYGRLVGILKTKVEDGVLNTLVSFMIHYTIASYFQTTSLCLL